MKTNRIWKKHGLDRYALYVDDQLVGRMVLQPHSKQPQAVFETGKETYYLTRVGLLAHHIVIDDAHENRVLQQKGGFFGADTQIKYLGQWYTCKVSNEPLASYRLLDVQGQLLLQYRFDAQVMQLEAVSHAELPWVFDFFLFYQMLPVWQEQAVIPHIAMGL